MNSKSIKAIPSVKGSYFADKVGRIWSERNGHMHELATWDNGHGYRQVRLAGEHRNRKVHQLVIQAFLGNCPPWAEIDHIDRDRGNNSLKNLRYIPKAQNAANRGTTGRFTDIENSLILGMIFQGKSVQEISAKTGRSIAGLLRKYPCLK